MILDQIDLLILAFVTISMIIWKFRKNLKFNPKDKSLSRERIIQLIKGEVKPKIYYPPGRIELDREEAHYASLVHRYKIGKMFEMAARNVHNKLELSDGSMIAPHSREHGFDAGKSVETLRSKILKEYGVDLAKISNS